MIKYIINFLKVKREAAWVISNATNRGSPESIATLVQYGVLETFVNLLESDDVKTIAVVLEGLKNVLNCGAKAYVNAEGENLFLNKLEALGGIPKLENLQTHPNQEIYEKCLSILETYFETETPF
jgi:importin subunit alpha-6/7